MRIQPTDATFGAFVTEVDLGNLSDTAWQVIEDAFHQNALLIFPCQHLTQEQLVAFGRRFGELEELTPNHNIITISNCAQYGRDACDLHSEQISRGNEDWHIDSSYMPLAAKVSMLSAEVVPSEGGQTEWADSRDAYDALKENTRSKIEGLFACHALVHSRSILDEAFFGPGCRFNVHDPQLRPLIKEHPVTGLKSLYLGWYAYEIPG